MMTCRHKTCKTASSTEVPYNVLPDILNLHSNSPLSHVLAMAVLGDSLLGPSK